MTDQTETATCPYCQHPAHRSGVECEGGVDHGPKHWHRCLCLNLIGSEAPCHPLMDCQGGKLGYSDIWYLQRGHTLSSADGPVTPDVLTSVPASSAVPAPATDRAAPVCKFDEGCHRVVACEPGCAVAAADMYAKLTAPTVDRAGLVEVAAQAIRDSNGTPEALEWWRTHPQLIPAHVYAAAVLAVLPASVDRATVYAEVADRLTADAEQGAKEGFTRIYRRSAAKQVREWGEELRRLAVEARDEREAQAHFDQLADELPSMAVEAQQQTETCRNCKGSGLDPRYNGEYACPDCPAEATALPAVVPGGAGEEPELAADPQPVSDEFVQRLATVKVREDAAPAPDDYERTTGHLITCLAAAGGQPDPDCPCAAGPAGGVQQPEPVVCQGFQWIGQSFATCDRCGQPAWEHAGMDVAVEDAGPFDTRRTVRPWEPGEADAIRAKWEPTP